jgi:SpoVK/Ycf46/Vps4 family AAA+-type ATPase
MLAEWIASQLNLRLVVLDLATSISSFLGKTGSNLKRSLDYARSTECVFLLDEFDSIGKRRDDITDIGELKRIVNVLLKELEDWPLGSVLIAATNHPELLDPAIHRRFDVVLETPLPTERESEEILARACGRFVDTLPDTFLQALARALIGRSGSELTTLAQSAVRRHVLGDISLAQSFIESALRHWPSKIKKKHLGTLIKHLQANGALTVRDIAELTGKSPSTVQYHLTKRIHA